MVVHKAPASWKQKRAAPPPVTAGLVRRRTVATLALLFVFGLAVGLIIWKFMERHQETVLLLASSSAASERQFALPPLRYVQQGWEKLDVLDTPWVHIDRYADNFADSALHERIAQNVRRLRAGDSLIVWVNGKGICHSNQPVIVGQGFKLPADADQSDPETIGNLIQVESILEAMSQWNGPKLLILEWGQELFDPRIACLGNNFLACLEDTARNFAADRASGASPVWILASHLPRQISLVDSRERHSLFNRAVSEALLGQRRLPSDKVASEHRAALPTKSEYLMLDNLVDYVHRRVRTDSAEFQTPWLLKSGKGLIKVEGKNWEGTEKVRLVKLDKKRGVPLGMATAAALNAPAAEQPPAKEQAAKQTPPETAEEIRARLPKAAPALTKLWQAIDQWRTRTNDLNGWSEAALAPLAYKQIAAKALDLDLRTYSGSFELSNEITTFLNDLEQHRRATQPAILAPLDPDVELNKKDAYNAEVEELCAARQVACLQLDTIKLVQSLSQLKSQSISSAPLQELARALQPGDPLSARTLLEATFPQALDRFIEQLQQKETNRGEAAAIAETLLRSCALSAKQRETLREFQVRLVLNQSGDEAWPAKPLENISAVEQIAQTQLAQMGDVHLTHSNTGVALLSKLSSSTAGYSIPLQALAAADGRDIYVGRVLDDLWSDIERGREFPEFPPRPEPPSQWLLRWQSAGTETTSLSEVVRLDSKKTLSLALTRTGKAPLSFPKISLVPQNVSLAINGQVYKVDEPVVLERSWFAGGDTLKVTFDVIPSDQRDQTAASLEVRTTGIKKPPTDLEFELPVSEPIQLIAEEQMLRDGASTWVGVPTSRSFFLYPFAGRETKYRFSLKNIDSLAHEVELRVFELPRNEGNATASFGEAPRTVPSLQGRVPDLVWQGKIDKGSATVADLKPPSSVTPPAAATAPPAAAGAAEPPPAAEPAAKLNLAGGCALELMVDGVLAKTYAMSVNPKQVTEYLDAQVQLDDSGKLQIAAQWVDRNRNGVADLAPGDLGKETPLVIRWDPLPWRIGKELAITARQIALTTVNAKPEILIARGLHIDRSEQEVWLDVDGTPRGLVYTLVRDQQTPATIPTPKRFRSQWRRYTAIVKGKSGASYVPYIPPQNDESEKETQPLIGKDAVVFPDLKSPIEVQLVLDLPEPEDRCSLLLGSEHVFSGSPDRIFEADMQSTDGTIVVRWIEKDLQVQIDNFSMMDIAHDITFTLTLATEQSQANSDRAKSVLPSIVVDCDPPELIEGALSHEQVLAGSTELVELRLRASDYSHAITAAVFARKAGALGPLPMGEPARIEPQRLTALQLDVSKLEPGDYQLSIQLEDLYKHKRPYTLARLLRVSKPPPVDPANPGGAPAVVGDLRVKAKRPGGGAIYNNVEFKIEPPADVAVPKGKDEITYKQLKAGSYKVSASFKEGSNTYQGNKTVEIKKNEDFARLVEIDLAKPEK